MSRPRQNRHVDQIDERHYEASYRSALLARRHIISYKIEPKHVRGWPDTYVPPGIHIEFKKIRYLSTRPILFWNHFDDLQVKCLRDCYKQGADCFVVVFWDMGSVGQFVQTMRFEEALKYERFDHNLILPFATPLEELREHVAYTWAWSKEIDGRKKPCISLAADAQTRLAG